MPPRVCGAIAFVSAALAIAGLRADQVQSPQLPTFRAGSVLVNVDAYPRRDGRIVEGLTKADFEVLEDGKAQSVENLEFIRVPPHTADAELRDPTSVEDGNRQAADPHNRVFVVYLDIFHTSLVGSHYTRQPVMEFLRRMLGPRDLFAVMTPELPATALTFGRRTEALEADLQKYWDWGEANRLESPRNPAEAQLAICGAGLLHMHREDLSASSLEQMVARLGNLRDERKSILFISEGWTPRRSARGGVSTSSYPAPPPKIGVGPSGTLGIGPKSNMSGNIDRAWCDAQAARLAGIDFERRFRDLLEMARRANVAFYPVDVAGLRAPRGGTPLDHGPVDTMRTLADQTDGRALVNTNDLVSGVRHIADDLAAFYLLRYYSRNTEADGKYRRIDVKVKAPGVKVSARRGYLAPTPAIRKAQIEAATRPVTGLSPVDIALGRLSRLRADARVHSAVVVSPAGLDVIVELSSRETEGARWQGGGTVAVAVSPKEGDAPPVSVKSRIESGARGALIRIPLTATSSAGWRIKIRVEGASEPIEEDVEALPGPASLVGEPTIFRAGPGRRSPLHPAAEYRFRRTERLHIEWVLAKPLDERGARLLSRRGDALAIPVTLTERQDGDRLVLAADLALAPLVDGDYVIELTGGAAGEKVQKLLAIRVVR